MGCASCGKNRSQTNFISQKYGSFLSTATNSVSQSEVQTACEVKYNDIILLNNKLPMASHLSVVTVASIRIQLSDWAKNIKRVCPDVNKFNTIKEQVEHVADSDE